MHRNEPYPCRVTAATGRSIDLPLACPVSFEMDRRISIALAPSSAKKWRQLRLLMPDNTPTFVAASNGEVRFDLPRVADMGGFEWTKCYSGRSRSIFLL